MTRAFDTWVLALTLASFACGGSPSTSDGLDAAAARDDGAAATDAAPPMPRLDAAGADAGPDVAPDVGAIDAAAGSGPPYPIVLAHGFFGFDSFAGSGFLTYFYGVREHLAAAGETRVFTPSVDPFASSEVRGAQLLAEVERIVAETGVPRVNLVGHSQGGLDARIVAHERPDLVASVTTIATPHHGTEVADIVLGLVTDDRQRALADVLVRVVGAPLWDEVGNETSVFAALRQLSTEGVEALNVEYPDAPGVLYLSIAGRTDLSLGGTDCEAVDAPDFVARFDRTRDPVDLLLELSEVVLDGGLGDPFPNDGLVRVRSARWGTFLGCIPADHLDEIGHLLGDSPGIGNDFRHLEFYASLVAYLRARGL